MSVYVYCPRASQGALELVRALGAIRLRNFDGMEFRDKRRKISVPDGSHIVCWGAPLSKIDGIEILNSQDSLKSKYAQWQAMAMGGIATINMRRSTEVQDPKKFVDSGYFPRSNNHIGGNDLLFGVKNPDIWTLKETFVNEYRIHSFNGRSIRAGIKVPRDGFQAVPPGGVWTPNSRLIHPWVRSFDGGWRINYDGFKSTLKLKQIAHAAVAALKLDFGAVDIGETPQGVLKVLEVNQAPGIENNSVES